MKLTPTTPNCSRKWRARSLGMTATLASITFAFSQGSLLADGPPGDDWYFDEVSNVWELDNVLTTNSETEFARFPGFAALVVQADQAAVIEEDGEWQLPLQDPVAIGLENGARLQLDGDLLVETDFDEAQLFAAAVAFGSGAVSDPIEGDVIEGAPLSEDVLAGAGDISIIHETSLSDNETALILSGVISDSELNIEDFDGSITVLNDNSGGLPTSDGDSGIPLPFFGEDFELDLDKSAVAIGLASINLEALFTLDIFSVFDGTEIIGELNQTVSATAISRAAIDVGDDEVAPPDPIEADGDDDVIDAVAGAISLGVVGLVNDGITSGADISATATAGDTLAVTGDLVDFQDAISGNIAAAVGFLGGASEVSGDVSITGTATSGESTAASIDGDATAFNVGLGVGAIGTFGDIDGGEEGDRVTISGEATSAQSNAESGDDFALSASAALAVGLGGAVEGGINATDITATSTSDRAQALAAGESLAVSAALSAGVIGGAESMSDSTITSTVVAGRADATGDGDDLSYDASALSLGIGVGYLGYLGDVTESEGGTSSVDVSVTSSDADADAINYAFADSAALAIGIGGFESLGLVLESLEELQFLGFGGLLPDPIEGDPIGPEFGVGSLAGTITVSSVAGDATATLIQEAIADDPIEGEPIEAEGAAAAASADAFGVAAGTYGAMSADITVSATAGNALADALDQWGTSAFAEAEAVVYGIVGALYGASEDDEFSGSVEVTATAGTADASSTDGDAYASSDAFAQGTGRVNLDMTGSVEATATAGTSTALSEDELSEAFADARAIGINGLGADLSGSVDVTATAGTADATTEDDDDAIAIAYAEAFAIYGNAAPDAPEPFDPIEGFEIEGESVLISGDLTATATGGTATASSDDSEEDETVADASALAYGLTTDDEFSDDERNVVADFTGTITSTATGGIADAESLDVDTDSDAYAYADAYAAGFEGISSYIGDLGGTIIAIATGGEATAFAEDEDAEADADASAYAVDIDSIGEADIFIGDVTGATTLIARGGVTQAEAEDEDADADADAQTAVIEDAELFEGEFGGTHQLISASGQAYAISGVEDEDADAEVYARAYGINMAGSGDSEFIGNYTATLGAYAFAGGSGDADLDFSELLPELTLEEDYGAWADSIDDSEAIADATASGIDDVNQFDGNFAGDVQIVAVGGYSDADALFGDAYANSYAEAFAVSFSSDEDDSYMRGDVTADAELFVVAQGGEARSIVEEPEGDLSYEGNADAESLANAIAAGLGRLYNMQGNYLAETSLIGAIGGEAVAEAYAFGDDDEDIETVDADADAEANAYAFAIQLADSFGFLGVADPVEGAPLESYVVDGFITLVAYAGEATATALGFSTADPVDQSIYSSASAEANSEASVIGSEALGSEDEEFEEYGFDEFYGDFLADVELDSEGGIAIAEAQVEVDAEADADAYVFDFDEDGVIEGNLGSATSEMLIQAEGGEARAVTDASELDPLNIMSLADSGRFNAYATADAQARVVDDGGSFIGDLLGTIEIEADGGDAYASGLGEVSADAGADAEVLDFDSGGQTGNINATVTATATAGTAQAIQGDLPGPSTYDYFVDADAGARAAVSDGAHEGDISGSFDLTATGGEAYVSIRGDEGTSTPAFAGADADLYGIEGSVKGNYDAVLTGTATGGTAYAEERDEVVFTDPIEGLDPTGDNVFADASAVASGIGDREFAINGESVGGSISLTATGGNAIAKISDTPDEASEIEGAPIEADSYAFGSDNLINANASAKAIGFDGNVTVDELTTDIDVVAQGGNALVVVSGGLPFPIIPIGPDPIEAGPLEEIQMLSADAFAAGIVGREVVIGEIGGDAGISATATPGLTEYREGLVLGLDPIEGDEPEYGFPTDIPEIDTGSARVGQAFAAGVMTYDLAEILGDVIEGGEPIGPSLLDVVIGTKVYTFVNVPSGFEEDFFNSYTAAVYSGQGDDYVELADGADLIGDINLGGGANTLVVTGDTLMEGDILSSSLEWIDDMLSIDNGAGLIDFDIESGLFTAVRTVNVSDLSEALAIAAEGGLSPILVQAAGDVPIDPEITTSLLSISGDNADVNIAAGATMLPVFDESVVLNGLVGNAYTIIDSTGAITDAGAIADGSLTPYNFSTNLIEGEGDQYQLVIDSLRVLDEEETPGNVQASDAVVSASQAVMLDLGKHAGTLRGLLRRNVIASNGAVPQGPAGPDASDYAYAQRMANGDWLTYSSVFGNIGQQDDEGGFAGYEYDTYGFTIGLEKLFGDQLILGVAGTYATTDIDGNSGSGGGDSDLMGVGVYGNWFSETWFFNGGLTYGQASSDVYRVGLTSPVPGSFGVFTGDYDSRLIGTWAELGYTHDAGAWSFEPFGRITYVSGDHDGYTESNAIAAPGFEQVVDNDETDNVRTLLGMRIAREWMGDNGGAFTLEGKAGWRREWADNSIDVGATYLGNRFELQSGEADENAIVLGLRAMWETGDGFGFSLEYEPTIAGNWYNHAFSGTLQYNW